MQVISEQDTWGVDEEEYLSWVEDRVRGDEVDTAAAVVSEEVKYPVTALRRSTEEVRYPETALRRSIVQELSMLLELRDENLPFWSDEALQQRLEAAREAGTQAFARARVLWTERDRANLVRGVARFGNNFGLIFRSYPFTPGLTASKLKVTYYNTLNKNR